MLKITSSQAYESYHEHLCTIPDEKDVIDMDIMGNSCTARFKRFWYGMFLLSYTNNAATRYYLSSYAMRIARIDQYRHYRSCIHPLSKFRTFWNCLIMNVMLINRILFHYNSSIIHNPPLGFHIFALLLEFIIIIDIFVNMMTGYFTKDSKKCIMVIKKIIIHYLSTNGFVHFASALPLEGIMFLRYGLRISCSLCKCTLLVATLKIISLITTIRIFQVTTYWNHPRYSFKVALFFKFFRIFILGMVIMLQILVLSDALSIIFIILWKRLDFRSYLSVVLVYRYSQNQESDSTLFLTLELIRMCKSFLLFGYGLHPNETSFDRLSALVSFMLAYGFHMWSFLWCYACVTRACFSEEQRLLIQDGTLNILRTRQLPDIMYSKVMCYYQSNIAPLTVTEKQNGLYVALPPALKKDIKMSCYKGLLMRLPFFSEWPMEVINGLVPLLDEEVYLPKDIIASAGSQSDGLIVVESGLLAVYSATQEETDHLIDGDYFGELSLVTDKEVRMNSVEAVTYCRVLFLDKSRFRMLMRSYPKLFFDMKRRFKEMFKTTDQEMSVD